MHATLPVSLAVDAGVTAGNSAALALARVRVGTAPCIVLLAGRAVPLGASGGTVGGVA